jgi:hypothetical protein
VFHSAALHWFQHCTGQTMDIIPTIQNIYSLVLVLFPRPRQLSGGTTAALDCLWTRLSQLDLKYVVLAFSGSDHLCIFMNRKYWHNYSAFHKFIISSIFLLIVQNKHVKFVYTMVHRLMKTITSQYTMRSPSLLYSVDPLHTLQKQSPPVRLLLALASTVILSEVSSRECIC